MEIKRNGNPCEKLWAYGEKPCDEKLWAYGEKPCDEKPHDAFSHPPDQLPFAKRWHLHHNQ
jgi:hypothetical protein